MRKVEAALDKPGPKMPEPGADELQKLLVARYNAVFAELGAVGAAYSNGTTTHHAIFDAQKRLLQAELELSDKPADQIAAYESYLESTKAFEAKIKALAILQTVGGEANKYYQAKFMRLDAEIQLMRAKRKLGLAK